MMGARQKNSLYFRSDYSLLPSKICNGVCIPLTSGRHAIIDADDYEKVYDYKWSSSNAYAESKTFYYRDSGATKMHRLITDAPAGKEVDHINGNRSDNRKSNLRICSARENHKNKFKKALAASLFKGVCFDKGRNQWVASISCDYKKIFLGRYDCELDAATAYNFAAIKYHGEYANFNEPAR